MVDSWKRQQLSITRDTVSISFNSFGNLVCPGEWGQNIRGKKRSQGVELIRQDLLWELVLELNLAGSERSYLMGKTGHHQWLAPRGNKSWEQWRWDSSCKSCWNQSLFSSSLIPLYYDERNRRHQKTETGWSGYFLVLLVMLPAHYPKWGFSMLEWLP